MITREQYFESLEGKTNQEKTAPFEAYYSQFVNDQIKRIVLRTFELEQLKKAYNKDMHLNSLPLKKWDNMQYAINSVVDKKLIKATGEGWSLSTSVCIAKQAARLLVREALNKEAETAS